MIKQILHYMYQMTTLPILCGIAVSCEHSSTERDYIWKHVRTQHHNKHLHICQFKSCKEGTNGRKYGNDELTSVWAHMMKCHGLHNPLGCPLCQSTFSGKAIQRKHIATCQELPQPRRQKEFFCPKEVVVKRCGSGSFRQTCSWPWRENSSPSLSILWQAADYTVCT